MKSKLKIITNALAENLWLIPLIAFSLALIMSRALVAFDRHLDVSGNAWFVYGGSPQGARQLLATIAGSMITFIGLVFSSTIVVLQLASSQFSPRVLRSFFRDRIIQTALGTFIATFAYAILILREIRETPAHSFVPGLSTFVAISLVWFSLAMFVAYINHIGQRIRAITVIETAAHQTATTLRHSSWRRPASAPFVPPPHPKQIVVSSQFGVISDIDARALVRLAVKREATFEVIPMIGDFLCVGAPIVRARCSAPLTPEESESIAKCVLVERERSMRNDPVFGFRQLVDIADKALSPGINDPTTAVQVLDQLHELLRKIASEGPRSDVFSDDSDIPRVFVPRASWQHYLDHALEEILLYGRSSLHVMRRLRTLVVDLEQTVEVEYRPALTDYRFRIEAAIDDGFSAPQDRAAARRLPPATEQRVAP
jgi:uncharacterized membrane protein